MFSLSTRIFNPWANSSFQNIWSTHKQVSKNKVVEAQLTKGSAELIGLSLDISFRNQDHAGIYFELCILGYSASLTLYDRRHWDREKDSWCEYHDTV